MFKYCKYAVFIPAVIFYLFIFYLL